MLPLHGRHVKEFAVSFNAAVKGHTRKEASGGSEQGFVCLVDLGAGVPRR